MRISKILSMMFFLCAASVLGNAQDVKECRVHEGPRSISYHRGHLERVAATEVAPAGISVDISIKSTQFSRNFLILLAANLRERYCDEELILVSIFDNKRVADAGASLIFHSQDARNAFRGTYYLNRKTGEENVSYVTGPDFNGNPNKRIKIDLTRTTSRRKAATSLSDL
jgi:hypothetical protein